jgi:hypothetical protein
MTCNPFISITARNSSAFLRPENINIRDFDDLLNFGLSAANKYDKGKLSRANRILNETLRSTDLSNLVVLNEKLEQSPVNTEELAEFLDSTVIGVDELIRLLETENSRRKILCGDDTSIIGTVTAVNFLGCSKMNPPGIHKKLSTYIDNTPGILTGTAKGRIEEDGSFRCVIYGSNLDISGFDESLVTGSGIGIEGISGRLKVTGFIEIKSKTRIVIRGEIKGGSYEPGYVVFSTSLTKIENGRGRNASFNVVVGPNGAPMVTIANSGSNYRVGDVLVLDELGCKISVAGVTNKVVARGSGRFDCSDPIIPISNFQDLNYPSVGGINSLTPNQPFIDLINSLDIFLNDNYGSSISSGSCGSSFLSLLSGFFDFFNGLGNFQVQLPDLSNIFGELASLFTISVPSILGIIQSSFMKIVESLINKARQTVNNIKNSIGSVGRSVDVMSKEIIDLESFFSKDNESKIKNLTSNIVQKLHDQFDKPATDLIVWMLTRLCQVSDFLSDFLQNPVKKMTSLLANSNVVSNDFINSSNMVISGVTAAGGVRFDRLQLLSAAQGAAQRSSRAGNNGVSSITGAPPARLTGFPISESDKSRVISSVSESGWSGFFDFSPSVINNNYGPKWGERLEGAGWRIIVRDNPALFAKLQKIIQELGNGLYRINSAYRSQEYQETKTKSSARKSAHTDAVALDVKMSQAQAVRFVPLASANGFNGIAYYSGSGFLHIDLRTNRQAPESRSWDTGGGLSRELRNAINNHQQRLYSV